MQMADGVFGQSRSIYDFLINNIGHFSSSSVYKTFCDYIRVMIENKQEIRPWLRI